MSLAFSCVVLHAFACTKVIIGQAEDENVYDMLNMHVREFGLRMFSWKDKISSLSNALKLSQVGVADMLEAQEDLIHQKDAEVFRDEPKESEVRELSDMVLNMARLLNELSPVLFKLYDVMKANQELMDTTGRDLGLTRTSSAIEADMRVIFTGLAKRSVDHLGGILERAEEVYDVLSAVRTATDLLGRTVFLPQFTVHKNLVLMRDIAKFSPQSAMQTALELHSRCVGGYERGATRQFRQNIQELVAKLKGPQHARSLAAMRAGCINFRVHLENSLASVEFQRQKTLFTPLPLGVQLRQMAVRIKRDLASPGITAFYSIRHRNATREYFRKISAALKNHVAAAWDLPMLAEALTPFIGAHTENVPASVMNFRRVTVGGNADLSNGGHLYRSDVLHFSSDREVHWLSKKYSSMLEANQVNHVLNICGKKDCGAAMHHVGHIVMKNLHIGHREVPALEQVKEAVTFLRERSAAAENVLVYCDFGEICTGTIVAAFEVLQVSTAWYALHHEVISYDDIVQYISARDHFDRNRIGFTGEPENTVYAYAAFLVGKN